MRVAVIICLLLTLMGCAGCDQVALRREIRIECKNTCSSQGAKLFMTHAAQCTCVYSTSFLEPQSIDRCREAVASRNLPDAQYKWEIEQCVRRASE
jgi:hypothetical protein